MSDITSTSFGYIIAFLLPGLAALYAFSFFSSRIAGVFQTFLTANSNIGLFLLVIATALGLGLVVTTWRFFLFERWLCRKHCVNPDDFARLGSEAKLTAYRAAIDETYRYHQFFGGISVVLPFLYLGWLFRYWNEIGTFSKFLSLFVFIIVEYGIGEGAMAAYRIYVARANRILADDKPAPEGGS